MRSSRSAGSLPLAWLAALPLGAMLIVPALTVPAQPASGQAPLRPVLRASCGPQDRPERGLQGQTTLAERFQPGPAKASTCNLELVGQFQGEGAAAGLDAFGPCAYFSTMHHPHARHPGVAVLDVSDARQPTATAYLDSPGMLGAFESVAVSPAAKLLIGSKLALTDPAPIDLYDLSADCRHPVLKSSVAFPGLYSHAGQFSADGRTYYGAKWRLDPKTAAPSAVFAVDVSQPASPRLLATWIPPHAEWITHGVVLSPDATRAYVALKNWTMDDRAKSPSPNGLVILDISEIQARRPQAQARLLGTLFWDDTRAAEGMQPVTIRGKSYLLFSDNEGAIGHANPRPADVCDSGKPGHGFARLIDVSDARHPTTVSTLMLEVADPAHCRQVMHDPATYGYGSFACSVDREKEGRLAACASFEAGLRVFDIRDPAQPREIAYYKPPARRTARLPGSLLYSVSPQTGRPADRTADAVTTFPRFRQQGAEIWFTSADNGFQVVRFTRRFQAAHPELFRN